MVGGFLYKGSIKMITTLLNSFKSWFVNDPFTDSAAIAYYAIFSIPGLLVIVLGMSAYVFEANMVEQEIFGSLNQIIGEGVSENIYKIVQETSIGNRNIWAVIVGALTLFFGATGLFVQLQRSLNNIWKAKVPKKKRLTPKFIRDRFISFGMIVVIGFLLMVSMVATALINLFSEWMSAQLSDSFVFILAGVDVTISIILISLLFMLIFNVLPDRKVKWRYAFQGGILSAVLFHIGEYGLNFYFSIAEPASTFGAAGSIILLMLWVYYSAMILLVGAEYTRQATLQAKKQVKEKAG
jgi:membrane protein